MVRAARITPQRMRFRLQCGNRFCSLSPMTNNPSAPQAKHPMRKPRHGMRGRALNQDALSLISRLIGENGRAPDALIENLHRLQDHLGCLPADHRQALAEWMNLPMAHIEEVATFYAHFDCVPTLADKPAPLTIRVCSSLPCQLAGAETLRLALQNQTDPKTIRIVAAPCLGSCSEAPAALLGERRVGHATPDKLAALIEQKRTGPAPLNAIHLDAYRRAGGYRAFDELRQGDRSSEDIMTLLSASGLQGLGGAGFPAGRKWASVRGQPQYQRCAGSGHAMAD